MSSSNLLKIRLIILLVPKTVRDCRWTSYKVRTSRLVAHKIKLQFHLKCFQISLLQISQPDHSSLLQGDNKIMKMNMMKVYHCQKQWATWQLALNILSMQTNRRWRIGRRTSKHPRIRKYHPWRVMCGQILKKQFVSNKNLRITSDMQVNSLNFLE